jgi:hypothetical protein
MSLVETRSLQEFWERLKESPAAIGALEFTIDKREPVLAALVRIGRMFPNVVPLVFAERRLAGWENVVREAGAIHFVVSPRRLEEVCEIARRRTMNVTQHVAMAPDDHGLSIEQRIFATLPWGGGE